MDSIFIEDLEVTACHGCLDFEKKIPQPFIISAKIGLDIKDSAAKDDLEKSVNYAEFSKEINKYTKETSFSLIETLAENLCERLLLKFEKIKEIEISIKKPKAPMDFNFKSVGVFIKRSWHEAFVALGSNLGDREKFLSSAIEKFTEDKKIKLIKTSSILETEPYGNENQGKFLNGVCKIQTLYSPEELLRKLNEIESLAGRERKERWGERTLDLDILFYDDLILYEKNLIIPHIDIANRIFVLAPMAELSPYHVHPVYKKCISQMLSDLISKSEELR